MIESMTRVERKPPRFYLETYDINGKRMNGALSARPKGQPRGWTLMLEHGGFHEFKFKRSALAFFARLVKLEVEVEETPVEDPALDRADEAIVSPAEYAELEAAADKCETGNKGCIEHGRDCENV